MSHLRRRPLVAAIAAFSLVLDSAMPIAAAASPGQAAKPAPTATAKPASTAAAAAVPVDGGWPRSYTLPSGGSVLMYQPQTQSWDKQAHLVAFSAVAYRTTPAEKPAMGTVRLEADTQVALSERLVKFQKLRIAEANFQTLQKDRVREIASAIERAIPAGEPIIALDRVLANIDKSGIVIKNN